MTPLQALLVTYSVASDDPLWYSQEHLDSLKQNVQRVMTERLGNYPAAMGRPAYGRNGYIFSTPLDILLDQNTTARIFERIDQRRR